MASKRSLSSSTTYEIGIVSEQGPRPSMEDVHCVCMDVSKECGLVSAMLPTAFFGVYDGHGGARTALYLEKALAKSIAAHNMFESDPLTALSEGFIRCDKELRKNLENSPFAASDESGSTAVVLLIRGNMMYWGHVGDTRAVMRKDGYCVELTTDHTPRLSEERERILNEGHEVLFNRVDGILAVSRAFGDFEFKVKGEGVSVRPDVSSQSTDGVEFVIIACDGLWDVVSSDEAVQAAADGFKKGMTSQEVSKALFNKAFLRHTTDNVTIVVVKL